MTIAKLLIFSLCLGSLSPGQTAKPTPIGETFRVAAEDSLDCLDGLALVETRPDQIFWPQSLKCRAMVRKLGRAAGSPLELSVANAIVQLQSKIMGCHIAGGPLCDQAAELRARVIEQGNLRVPGSPGE